MLRGNARWISAVAMLFGTVLPSGTLGQSERYP